MSRKELYNKVKELGIAKKIEEKFHQNFTRVSNIELEEFIKSFVAKNKPKAAAGDHYKVIIRLVSTLQAKKYLTAAEADDILKML